MNMSGTLLLLAIGMAAMIRSFSLQIRYLEHGIAYLRYGRVVIDHAMPIQGVLTAVVAAVTTWAVVTIDPSYPNGAGVLPLVLLDAAGAMGLILVPIFLMASSDMRRSIDYRQPLFLRDRTPGNRSRRHVTVHLR